MEDKVIVTLTPAQFWEWRQSIEEMQHAKTKADLALTKHRLMEKNVEVETYKSQIFKQHVSAVQSSIDTAKTRYEDVKHKLEKELSISLNNKMIDELTFEVKEAPNDKQ